MQIIQEVESVLAEHKTAPREELEGVTVLGCLGFIRVCILIISLLSLAVMLHLSDSRNWKILTSKLGKTTESSLKVVFPAGRRGATPATHNYGSWGG